MIVNASKLVCHNTAVLTCLGIGLHKQEDLASMVATVQQCQDACCSSTCEENNQRRWVVQGFSAEVFSNPNSRA